VSAHFVNNVLAAAASYIDEDPEQARDVLAELGQFLAYGLRTAPTPATLSQELAHTATYLRLQQARFPGRLELRLPADAGEHAPSAPLAAGVVRGRVAQALEQRLRTVPGPCVVDLHRAGDALELELRGPGDLVGDAVAIPLSPIQEVAS
jgi:two-component system LytT family sensor kinase